MLDCFEFKKSYFQALKGIEVAKEYIKNNRLKSLWSERGFGWQELLHRAQYAGFYASCEGIEILGFQLDGSFNIDTEIFKGVYKNHLLKILNKYKSQKKSSDKDNYQDFFRDKQQIECKSEVPKIARFITITSRMINILDDRKTYENAIDILKKSQLNDFSWSGTIDKTQNTCFVCSAEALIALYSAGQKLTPEFLNGLKWAFSIIENFITSNDPKIDTSNPLLLSWCLSEIIESLEDDYKMLLLQSIEKLINLSIINKNQDISDSFYVPQLAENDYYRLNHQLIFCSTILNCCNSRLIEPYIIYELIEVLNEINRQFNEKGYFTSGYRPDFHFWENYQAYFVLFKFVCFLEQQSKIKEESLMYVNPKLFIRKNFTINSSLCVVIMPFREKWSNTVFDVFKEVVEDEFGLVCWRSDNEFSDDVIIQTVWEKLNQAKFVIADCTGQNANVFYELGIAHTLGRPVFMCAQSRKEFVFDIAGIRSYVYSTEYTKVKNFKKELASFIRNL